MQLIHALAAGIVGAENGTAEIYDRGGSSRISYYLGDGGFEGSNQQTAGTDVDLDEYGSAVVYVTQYALVIVKDSGGTTVRTFTVGNYDAALEVISPSFTGTAYATGASGANKPLTLEQVLDAIVTSFGTTDWKVPLDGVDTDISVAIATISGYFENVKSATYGAAGDGVTNDTAAIQAAFTAASTSGRIVFFPPGTYYCNTALTWPSGISLLGCGPDKSILKTNSSGNSLFTSSATGTQAATGLAFGAAQSHTDSLISVTASGRFQFRSCKIGDDNTISASAQGLLKVDADSVGPVFELIGTEIYLPDAFAGQVVTAGTQTGTTQRAVVDGCTISLNGDPGSSSRLFSSAYTQMNGCYVDLSAATTGTVNLLGTLTAGIIEATGNAIVSGGGATINFINGNGGATVVESGNRFGSDVVLVATYTGGIYSSLGSRRNRIYVASHGSTSALDLSSVVLNYECAHITITSSDAFTVTLGAPTSMEGLEFELNWENDAGGATGTITYNTASFAGTTSVTGTAPPTSIAAVGTIVSMRFRAYNGPDGHRFYPVGQAYAGT